MKIVKALCGARFGLWAVSLFCGFGLFAETYTWKATASGNWEDAANWDPSTGYPSAADDVAIVPLMTDDTTVTVTVNDPLKIASLSVGQQSGQALAGKVTVEFKTGLVTNEFSGAVTVAKNGTLTHYGPLTTESQGVIVKCVSMSVESGGAVSVTGKGYTFSSGKAYGPGAGRDNGRYGGLSSATYAVGRCYGSIRNPTNYGSSVYYVGKEGPGMIQLFVSGALTMNGAIAANGQAGNVCASSGGSVLIRCGTLTGSGSIAANGGECGDYSGSGGRVAVYATASDPSSFSGTISAKCGSGKAGAGTVYLEGSSDTSGEGTLIIDNGGNSNGFRTPLTDGVEGSFDTFGKVVVKGYGYLEIAAGKTLKVTKGISCSTNGKIIPVDDACVVEFVGSEEATFTGGSLVDIRNLICTNAPGKTIKFGTAAADKWTINEGKTLIFKGAAGDLLKLRSTTDGTRWPMSIHHNAGFVDVDYVDVQDADASSGASVVAAHSTESSNNLYWGFTPQAAAGETITWTGAKSTDWENCRNWDPDRTPTEDDVIVIPSVTSSKYPIVPAATYRFNKITVQSGASLTWKGCTTTITNDLIVAGTMAFTAGEPLYVQGNVTVTGSVTPASGTIYVVGSGDQTLDFGDTTLYKIQFDKPSGDVSFGTHGFTATQFNCQATTAIDFTFHAGATYSFAQFLVNGIDGDNRRVTMKSDTAGTKWKLVATADGQNVGGVNVSDSDATDGATVFAGLKSRQTNCLGWDTESDVAAWIGGTGDFTNPANWTSGTVPGPNTLVTVTAGDGVTLTATLPAGDPLTVKQLTVYAGTGGKATFAVNRALIVRENVVVRSGGVLEYNVHNDYGAAPNVVTGNVTIATGGVLSHSGPGTTEANKLHLKVLGAMTVDAGGKVSVDGKGYTFTKSSKAYGPGAGRDNGRHAGYSYTGYATGICYGSIRNPTNFGSSVYYVGKESPGAIHLEVPGTLTVNGAITANGAGGNVCASAGGSVWIECGTLTGAGTVTANGGNCGQYSGSGGRVAVAVRTSRASFSGSITALCAGSGATCGTVYLENPGDTPGRGTLMIDNGGNNNKVNNEYYWTPLNPTILGSSEPFDRVQVSGYGRLVIESGATLRAIKELSLTSTGYVKTLAGAAVEFVGGDDLTFTGAKNMTVSSLVCTNVSKKIFFGTTAQDKLTVPEGATLNLKGVDLEHPLQLLPNTADGKWSLDVNADATRELYYLAVSNSTSAVGITAFDSQNLGGNTLWSFSSVIHPGDVITWTGGVSTDWADGQNWNPARPPVETDDIRIAAATSGKYPVIPSGNYSFNKLSVASSAQLTLSGCNVTVTNKLTVAGGLLFAGSETLTLTGDADLRGGVVTRAQENVIVAGEGNQACDFGGCTLNKITISKTSGDVSFGVSGFTVATLNCRAMVAMTLKFAAGATYVVNGLYLNGVSGENRLLSLESTESGTPWFLTASVAQGVAGVTVADSDASLGATVYAGSTSAASGTKNRNWDFERDVAAWVGPATGNFTDAANWASGKVPTNTTHVSLRAGDGETLAVTLPANVPTTLASLTLSTGTGGTLSFVVNSGLIVRGDVDIGSGVTLVYNAYANDGVAPNVVTGDVRIASGGKITHSGPNATENAKVHLKVLGDMTIAAGGSVDVTGKGYSGNNGPGGSPGYEGAGHAGYGYPNHAPYGSILRPFTGGSATQGVAGGGAVHLDVAGTLCVEGHILADGTGNGTYASAGGSVWIACGALTGGGLLAAREGLTGSYSSNYTSSGGRIAVYQRVRKGFSAFPLERMKVDQCGSNAAGTIYLESADKSLGTYLYVKGGANGAAQKTMVPMVDDGDALKLYREVNLIVCANAWVVVPNKLHACFRDIELQASSSKLYVNGGTLDLRSIRHLNGKKWLGTVDYGGTTLNPGLINWIGGADGAFIFVR